MFVRLVLMLVELSYLSLEVCSVEIGNQRLLQWFSVCCVASDIVTVGEHGKS